MIFLRIMTHLSHNVVVFLQKIVREQFLLKVTELLLPVDSLTHQYLLLINEIKMIV